MKREFWSKECSVSEVIETVDMHCSSCGQKIRFIVPPKLQSDADLAEHYRKLSNHYAEKWSQAQAVIQHITEKLS